MPFYHDIRKKSTYFLSFFRKELLHLNLQILYQCNFTCTICDFWKEPHKSYPSLSLDQIRIIAAKIKYFGPQVISISGGEPLLHKELPEIVSVLAKNNFPVMICNGWFMTPEKARELWQAGMYEVSISVDYIEPWKHDRQRGTEGAFAQAVEALRILNEQRTGSHQRVHMISVVMDDNIDDIEPLIHLAKKIGVTYLVTLYSNGRGDKESRVSDENSISQHLTALWQKYPAFVSIPGYLDKFSEAAANNGMKPCYAGKNLFNIDSQGNVTRCIDSLDDVAGNILTDDVVEIRRNLLHQFEKSECSGCWTSCRGSIEPMLYGDKRVENILHCYRAIKDIPLVRQYDT